MANQAGTSSADSPEQQIKSKHSDMVIDLSRHFSPDLHHWEELLQRLSDVLEPVYLGGKDNNFMKICNALMAKGTISYGSYDYLYEVISKIDVRPAKIIKKASDEIKDIQSRGQSQAKRRRTEEGDKTKGPSQANRPRTEEGDQTKDKDPKLTPLIKTTKSTVGDQTSRPEIISTQALEDAKEVIRKNGMVIIKGASGDGKTMMCYQLLKWLMDGDNEDTGLSKDPLQLYSMSKWDDIVQPDSQIALFIDDVSGDTVEDLKRRKDSIQSAFCGKLNSRSNCLILNVRDEIFKSTQMSSCELFNDQFAIDLRGKNLITNGEKLKILQKYVPNIKDLSGGKESEIVKLAPKIGFPQCCRLYRDVPKLQSEGLDFFKNPIYFIKKVLEELPKECFASLLFLFLNKGSVKKGDLDPNSKNIDKKKLDIAFPGIELSPEDKIRLLRRSLGEMLGSLLAKTKYIHLYDDDDDDDDVPDDDVSNDDDDDVFYKFSHDSVQDTIVLCYGNDTKIGFIENCPSKYLRYVTTSKTSTNKVVISSDNNVMYKRLLTEFESVYSSECGRESYWFYSRRRSITSLDVWTDIEFLKGFIRWLSGQNDNLNLCHEIKLALLNRACSSGSEQCALFLLSEGVEPDEETPFCVVKGGSVSLLHKLLEYEVTQTAKLHESQSQQYVNFDINVLQEACLFEREEMVTILCNTYPNMVHDTVYCRRSTLHLVAYTGNFGIFKTVERIILKSLYRKEDEQHKCERVEGRVVHRSCVCAQYMCQLLDDEGETVLHYSCHRRDLDFFKYLCESYPQLITIGTNTGWTVLHHSFWNYYINIDVVKYLCESYPKLITDKDNDGWTVLHVSCRYSKMDAVKYLCESYPQLITEVTNTGQTVLQVSCKYSNMDAVKYLCESYPQLATAVDNDRWTVLHVSCLSKYSNMDVVKYLCESYPQLATAVDNTGETVLHVSCGRHDSMGVIRYLCESNPQLATAVDNTGRTVLHVSCQYKNMDVVKYLFESYPQLTTAVTNTGWTVLHVSCQYKNMDVVKYLCESYPQLITAVDNDRWTVLHVSCRYSNMDVVKYLCKSYPQLTTAVDNDGWHCLHFIARYTSDVNLFTECESVVKQYIISTGGKYDITTILTIQGESVLDLAKERTKEWAEFWGRENSENPLYDYLDRLFGQQKQ